MDARLPVTTDPQTLLDTLDAEAITSRLEELDRERRALRVLLRAARARQRQTARDRNEERRHAD